MSDEVEVVEKEICPICKKGYIVKKKNGSFCIPWKEKKTNSLQRAW